MMINTFHLFQGLNTPIVAKEFVRSFILNKKRRPALKPHPPAHPLHPTATSHHPTTSTFL